ncbi:hypothetical protein pb186bvf_019894 [Paramecium bursaria]
MENQIECDLLVFILIIEYIKIQIYKLCQNNLYQRNPQWDYPLNRIQGYQFYNFTFKQGPLEERGGTDCFWCILFLGQLAMLIAISVFVFTEGDPDSVFVSYNSVKFNHFI